MEQKHQLYTLKHIAHDLEDPNKSRSKDVTLKENIHFQDLYLASKTLVGLEKCGFDRPSPIQLETIPLGRCGFDLVVQSKAGTGKTCIFTIIALESLEFDSKCTQTLIIAPTREIAIQIHEVISAIGIAYENLTCALCIGGVEVKRDRAKLASKLGDSHCQIVIGTPGRIKQLIELDILKVQHIELFVLDEADKLMDEKFKLQIDEIYKRLPFDKQMIVTSATYPNELSTFLQHYMRSPKSVRLGQEVSLEAVEEFYVESKSGHSVFTNFQARAPLIYDTLNGDENFSSENGKTSYLCAELSQDNRTKIFNDFKRSNQKLLVSTDVCARGIDIEGIELVINFDLPPDRATYYHRIGRAGRFGQAGRAVSIVSGESGDKDMFDKSVKSQKINKLVLTECCY